MLLDEIKRGPLQTMEGRFIDTTENSKTAISDDLLLTDVPGAGEERGWR